MKIFWIYISYFSFFICIVIIVIITLIIVIIIIIKLLLSDCNWTRTHNHLVRKQTLNHFAKLTKWLSWVVSTYLYDAFNCMFLYIYIYIYIYIVCIYTFYLFIYIYLLFLSSYCLDGSIRPKGSHLDSWTVCLPRDIARWQISKHSYIFVTFQSNPVASVVSLDGKFWL